MKKCVYVKLSHFAIQQQVMQHCNSTILKKKVVKNSHHRSFHLELFYVHSTGAV